MRRISMAIAGLLVLSGCESSGTGTGPVASAGGAPSEMSSIGRSEAATEFGQPAENVRTVPIEQSVVAILSMGSGHRRVSRKAYRLPV